MMQRWKKKRKMQNEGISEIIGTVVLLAVAVASFSVLYVTLSATLITEESPQVNVIGYIEENSIILEHQGGDTLKDNTQIDFVIGGMRQSFTLSSSNENFTFDDSNNNGEWDVGERITYSSSGSFSNLAVDTSIVDTASNKALFIGSLQDGETNVTPVIDLSTVVEMLPSDITNSPYQINASGSNQLDNVTLFYAFSSSNWSSCSNQTISFDDFENGFGNYTSGGSNCDLYTDETYAYQGENAIHIQNGGEDASFSLTNSIDLNSVEYTSMLVDFWFTIDSGPGAPGQFVLDYFDGSEWQTIVSYSMNQYSDGEFYHKRVWINESSYDFPTDANIRFRGDMPPRDMDHVYFDNIYINVSCDEGTSSQEPDWIKYATDLNSPWNWDFTFLNGSGYYRFYSIGKHNDRTENPPSTKDTFCYYNESSSLGEVSIWHFDQGSGTIAFDSSDDNDGTVNGATWTTGVQNNALLFDGENDFISMADSENLNFDQELTVMAWVKWSINPSTGESWANIINKGEDAQWQIQHSNDNSNFEFAVKTDESRVWIFSNIEPKQEVWYHVAGVYDGSEIRLYVNGSLDNQDDLTGDIHVTDHPLNIGRRSYFEDRYFAGIIDEVYLYDKALSDEELQTYYNQTKPQQNDDDALIAQWNFNEGDGTIAYDSSGNYNNGTITLASWTNGVNGSALLFNNEGEENEYVSISDDESLDLSNDGSVEAWVKINSFQDFAGIVHKGSLASFSDEAYTLQFWDSGRNILFSFVNDAGGYGEVESNQNLNTDEWYHLVGTWDSSAIKLYINGELDNEETNIAGSARNTDGSIQIGTQLTENYPGYGYFGFDGIIDQVAIYNTALTATEISNHYNENQP